MFLHTKAPTHTKCPSLIFDWISCIGSNITKINAHPWVFLAKKSHFDGGAKLTWGNNISCYTLAEWIMKWLCADRHIASYITMACCYFEYRMLPRLDFRFEGLWQWQTFVTFHCMDALFVKYLKEHPPPLCLIMWSVLSVGILLWDYILVCKLYWFKLLMVSIF